MKLSDNELMIMAAALNHLAEQTAQDMRRGLKVQDVYDDIMNLGDRIYIERYPVELLETGKSFNAECPICAEDFYVDAPQWGYTDGQPLCGSCLEQYAPKLYAEALMSSRSNSGKSITRDDAIEYMCRIGIKTDVIAAVMGIPEDYVKRVDKNRVG